MRTTVVTIVSELVLAAASFGCSAPATPSPAVPPGPVANIAGRWSGTFESGNFSTRTITMTIVQGGNCVDGAWASASGWTGAISGFAGADSFSGQISFEAITESGERCAGVGDTSGTVGTDTLRWTSAGFTAVGPCTGTLHRTVVISLRRG